MKKLILSSVCLSLVFFSCKKEESNVVQGPEIINKIPEFYSPDLLGRYGKSVPEITFIAGSESKILNPQDLDFNPTRPNELWIINKGTPNTGGSTVMLTAVGKFNQQYDYRQDGNAWHFMSQPSALSFSQNGNWATSHNILDANHQGGTFTGPTLWSSDLNTYARDAGPGTNGSHLDMLHTSPLSMGIESERDNLFWVFDGYNQNIVRYDFAADHGPGNHDHSDGRVHRYTQVSVKRDPLVPSHLVFDENKEWLYIVDGGNQRILRMNVTTGIKLRDLPLVNEPLEEYWEMTGVVVEEFISKSHALQQPSGIEINGNRLFVSDFATGEIVCFSLNAKQELGRISTGKTGITGIKIGEDKKIYFVCSSSNEVLRVDPK